MSECQRILNIFFHKKNLNIYWRIQFHMIIINKWWILKLLNFYHKTRLIYPHERHEVKIYSKNKLILKLNTQLKLVWKWNVFSSIFKGQKLIKSFKNFIKRFMVLNMYKSFLICKPFIILWKNVYFSELKFKKIFNFNSLRGKRGSKIRIWIKKWLKIVDRGRGYKN